MPDITSLSYQLLGNGVVSPGACLLQASSILQDGVTRDAIPRHPLGVKPSGNALFATDNLRNTIGTFSILPDDLILTLLEFMSSSSLLRIGRTCKAFYAFTRADELWKTLFVESFRASFSWKGTWRSTYLGLSESQIPMLDCSSLFSDALHRPLLCAHISLGPYVDNIPPRNQITRLPNLSLRQFQERWSNTPFILTDPVREWPAYKEWSIETLLTKYKDVIFRAESVDWPFNAYVDYMKNNVDERPLYLFDRDFVSKMDIKVSQSGPEPEATYWPPFCFGEDYFSVLGSNRPDRQWLIIGPERSGSSFHKDPNATSAWNAVIRGRKYWIMFPSSTPSPPGVYVSDDQSEVTSPLSIAEWLLVFHAEARRTLGCVEGICEEGEVLHVPSGWWHLVINLEPAIAITQNFIPRAHLPAALDFLCNKPGQISGFRRDIENPSELFLNKMREMHSEILGGALEEMKARAGGRKRKWDKLTGKSDQGSAGASEEGFSFGFGDEGSDVEVP